MPKIVSEIAAGQQFQRSSDQGNRADSHTRVFRIVLNEPGEVFYAEQECGISIGDQHPYNSNIYCVSWDAKFEGDSRTTIIATFNYQSTPTAAGDAGGGGGDGRASSPEVRPANWSTSTSLVESPVQTWSEVDENGDVIAGKDNIPAVNPVGDMYDGVSRLEAIVTINIEQYEPADPTKHCRHAGCVNEEEFKIGSLTCPPGSVMLRGVQCRPIVEAWGRKIFRGWLASYELAYRANHVHNLFDGTNTYNADIGWDIANPQTGFNVKMLPPAAEETFSVGVAEDEDIEAAGFPLRHESGKIKGWPNSLEFFPGGSGRKARSMVLVYSYEDGGASQLPSAQPIPLNDNGTPRWFGADPKVIVRRYRTNKMINFKDTFKFRLG